MSLTPPSSHGGGGAAVDIAVFSGSVNVSPPAQVQLIARQLMPITDTGVIGIVQTSPPFTFAAGVVGFFTSWSVANVDTTGDDYDISVAILVSNTDGSEQILLAGSGHANSGIPADSATIGAADLSVSTSTGSDLSYADGNISSAAGGTYSITVAYSGERD